MAYEALDSLLQKLTQILKRDDDLTSRRVKRRIISIHDKAAVLQLNLKAFPEKEAIKEVVSATHETIEYIFSPKNLSIEPSVRVSNQLRELAAELDSTVGDVVEYCKLNNARQLSEYPPVSSSSRSALASRDAVVGIDEDPTVSMEPIARLSQQLGRFAEKILSIGRELADYSRSNDDSVNSVRRVNDSPRSAPTSNDVVVGIDEDLTRIMNQLTTGSSKLEVVPIVGMGGIGKTTLAKIVYDNALIRSHFNIRAWITMSAQDLSDYVSRITRFSLLASIKGKGKEIEAESDQYDAGKKVLYNAQELRKRYREILKKDANNSPGIREHLEGRRYLIVMDNVWSTKVWDGVRFLFPDNDNGSRIILTTRLLDVAASIAGSSSNIHMMRFLDDKQSWHLFQRKVFADQTCPLELQSVAEKIVRSCGGLPLSIVKVAEHLSGIGTTPKLWEQIVATDGDGQLESILSLSYNHLPHHLKECFLYMAGFPEDYKIRVSELIKLWVAEGFLEGPYKSKSLEETAEEYLKVLIENSLVLVTSRKIDGKIKSCRLHNMVRDFCVRQAGQKKLLLPVKDYLPTPILRRHFLPQVLKNHRRISASWYDLDLRDSMYSSYTHSIICIPQKGYRPKGSVRNFRSLRVFHVLRRDDHSYWELGQVFDLIHLRYLASNIPSSIVPPAISKLQNLQTLIIYKSQVSLPMEIWRLQQLRHLMAFSFHPLPQPEAAALPLENLQTLSLATNLVCSRRMAKMIPSVQKLGICYSREKFDEDYHLDNLTQLLRLEKLKLEMSSGAFWPSLNRPVFPVSLKKLTLSGCRLPWRDMRIVGWLANLQVLKLRNYACDGEYWKTNAGEFDALRLLLIDESNIQQWLVESGSFPRLECLMLHRCPSLSEIPVDMGKIPTLRLIEVDDLNQSLLYSTKMIEREQHDYGNEIQVILKHF